MDPKATADWRITLATLNRSLQLGLDRAEARAFRERNLARLAAFAHARSPFYRDRLAPVIGRHGARLDRWNEIPMLADFIESGLPHARHDPHAHHDVGAVSDLNTQLGDVRAEWTHRERNHVHGSPTHAALEEPAQRCTHCYGIGPVVRRAGVFWPQ